MGQARCHPALYVLDMRLACSGCVGSFSSLPPSQAQTRASPLLRPPGRGGHASAAARRLDCRSLARATSSPARRILDEQAANDDKASAEIALRLPALRASAKDRARQGRPRDGRRSGGSGRTRGRSGDGCGGERGEVISKKRAAVDNRQTASLLRARALHVRPRRRGRQRGQHDGAERALRSSVPLPPPTAERSIASSASLVPPGLAPMRVDLR